MVTALAAYALALCVAALLTSGPPVRRALGVAAGAAGLLAPWLAPAGSPLGRAAVALGAAWGFARVVDLARARPAGAGTLRRLLHAFVIVDTRLLVAAPRALEARLLAKAAAAALLGAAALALALAPSADGSAGGLALRWAAAVVFTLAVADALDGLVRALFRLAGFAVRPLQDAPLRSVSLREFWGRRWNSVVQRWLSEHAFAPAARRGGAAAGTLAAFGASAILHAYLLLAAAGPAAALTWAAFFASQGGLVLAEARLGVRRWRPWPARAWTFGTLAATAPLFAEPMLRCLG